MANQIRFDIGFNVDKTGLNELQKSLTQVQNAASKATGTSQMEKDLRAAGQAAGQLSNILNQSWNSKLGQLDLSKVNNGIKQTFGDVKKLKAEMEKSGPTGAAAYNQVASAILNTNLQLKQSNKLLDEMAVSMANTVKWGITSSIFNNITGSIQKAYGYTKKLDSSLNDIRIVTDKSAESMEKFAIQANQAAKGLGASTLDYTQASLIYYQQGLDDAEVAARAETTLKAANVTGQSGAEVSEQLTAVWNGYKVTAQEAELYVDKLAAVAADTAADLEELSTGMSKVASAASLMGVDIDQLNAQLATIVSVTRQAPESVGTALKTIYARMGDIEAGLDTETTLGNYTEEMANMGFNVLDMNGHLRDMGEVIEEIGSKWSSMSREQQISLSQTVAGTRQYNNLLALFDNWDMYTNAIETSANAAGTLQKQQDTYMESTEAHLKTLSTEAERTYDILFNQDTVNGFADALTGVLGIFNDFIEGIGGGGNALLYFGSIAANVFNKQIAGSIQNTVKNIKSDYANKVGGKLHKDLISEEVSTDNTMSGTQVSQKEALEAQYKIAGDLLKVKKGLTIEEQQQYINIQRQIGLNREQASLIKNYKDKARELLDDENASLIQAQSRLEIEKKTLIESEQANANYRESLLLLGTEEQTWENKKILMQSIKNLSDKLSLNSQDQLIATKARQEIVQQGNISEATRKQLEEIISSTINEQKVTYNEILNLEKLMKLYEDGELDTLESQNQELLRQKDILDRNGNSSLKMQKTISMTMAAAQGLTTVLGTLPTILDESTSKADKAQSVFSGISGIFSAVGSAFGPMGMAAGMIGSAIVSVIGSFITKGIKEQEEAIAKSKENWEKLHSDIEQSNSNIKTLDSLTTEFERLSLGVSQYGENISLTADEYEQYQDIVEQIAKISPELVQGYDEEGQAILNNNNLIQDSINLLREKQKEEKKSLLDKENMENTYKAGEKEYADASAGLEAAKDEERKYLNDIDANYGMSLRTLVANDFNYESLNIPSSQKEAFENATKEIENLMLDDNGFIDFGLVTKNREQIEMGIKQLENTFSLSPGDLWEGTGWTSTTDVFFSELDNKITNENEGLAAAAKKVDIETKKKTEATKFLNDKVLTWIEAYDDSYGEAGTEQQLAIQRYIDSFSTTEYNDDVFNEFTTKAFNFSQTLAGLSEDTSKQINDIFELKDTGTYQEYIDAVIQFFKDQAETENGLSEEQIMSLFGLSAFSIEDNTITEEITAKRNLIQKQFQDKGFGENFNINEYFSGEDILNADGLTIKGINFDVESIEEFEELYHRFEINKAFDEAAKSFSQIQTNITSLNKGLQEFQKEGAISEETLLDLERRYPELANIQDKSSHEYLQRLREIREQEEDNAKASLEEQRKTLKEKVEYYSNLDYTNMTDVQVQADLEEFEKTMQQLLDTEYALQVQIEADLKTDVEDAFGIADEFSKLQDLVPEDLTVSFKEAQELINQGYAGILENATETAEQSIKLDKATMNAFIDNRQAELEEDKKAKIAELENQKIILMTQRDALTKKLEALKEAKNAESGMEAAAALRKVKDADIEYQAATDALNKTLDNEAKAATETEKIDAQLYNHLAGMYTTDSENQQQASTDTTNQEKDNIIARVNNIKKLFEAYQSVRKVMGAIKERDFDSAIDFAGEGFDKLLAGLQEGAEVGTTESQVVKSTGVTAEDLVIEDWDDYVEKLFNENKAEYDASINASIEAVKEELKDVNNQIGARDAGIAALKSGSKSLDSAQKGSGSDRKEEYKKEEDEIDRYWELNKAIEAVIEEIDKLDKKQDNLYGKELIASLKEENKLLEQQADRYRDLAAEQQREASELQGLLSAYGVVFDAQGGVANYLAATQAALARYNQAVAAYNAFLIDEATFKAEQRAYENFKSLLDRYEALYYQEMKDTQDKLDEIHRQELENNLKAWEVEIQLKLDMTEIERQWDDFFKDINENFKLVYEDLDAVMQNLADKMTTYQGEDGDIATTLKAIKDVQAEIDKMKSGGESDMFESISQAQEKLKELNEQLQDSALAMKELWEEAWDAYLEGIDQAADKFDDLMEHYEDINEEIEYQRELIELLYGEEAYELMDKYYEAQQKNTMSEIDSLKQQAELWKQQYEEALAIDEANGTISEDTQKFYELWQEAQDGLNGKVIDYIELLQNDYKNTISSIINDLEKFLTNGSSLDEAKEQWELLKEEADRYYDSVERVYEISSLANKIEQGIANTSSLKNQQKLQELYDKEIKYLENKKNLTEYDIEYANAKYELALRQIALEEAQQNKNTMKLTRGADGNWSYQYVADEEDVANKQQELMDMANELYQITDSGTKDITENITNAWTEYLEKLAEIQIKYENDEELRKEKERELEELYRGENGIITNLMIEYGIRKNNMAEATYLTLSAYYEADAENYERMTTKEQELIDGLKDGTLANYESILEKAEEVCKETSDLWSSTAITIAEQWYKDGGESVKTQIIKAYEEMEKANKEYQDAVAALEKAVEQNFGEDGITGALNDAQEETEELDDKTEELCDNAESNLERYREAVNAIGEAWESVKSQIQDAIDLIREYLNIAASAGSGGNNGGNTSGGNPEGGGPGGPGDDGKNPDDGGKNPKPGPGKEDTEVIDLYASPGGGLKHEDVTFTKGVDRYTVDSVYEKLPQKEKEKWEENGYYKYIAKIISTGQYGYIKDVDYDKIKGFKTGGYTGNWESENGKLAFLHSKELVLNAKDTENILSAVNTVRSIANLGDSINQSIMNGISQMVLGLTGLGKYGNYSVGETNSSGNTIFEIQANFPNANDVESIREAILSLPNLASQYIARNKK